MTKLTVMITGASRGIGLATAKKLAKQGHSLALFDIDTDTLGSALTDKVFKKAHKAKRIVQGHLDVTSPEDWDSALEHTVEHLGGIDVLINNAGILVSGELPKTELEQQLKLVDINCNGVLIGCHKAAQRLKGDKYSKIINLSSASAIYGQSEIAPYSASKFFVRGLTEALNIEYAALGIKVVDVMPLWVNSNLTKGVEVTSIKRLGINLKPEDVANTINKLVSKPNNRVNKPHYAVGMPAKLLNSVAQVSPEFLVRSINKMVGVK